MNFGLDVLKLLHQLFINMQSTSGIEDNDIISVVLRMLDRILCDLHWTDGSHLKHRSVYLLTDNFQLFNRCRTINVTGNQQRTFALLAEHLCQFCRVGGFTGTLQTAHHDDSWNLRRKIDSAVSGTHQLGQFISYNLDYLLSRCQAGKNFLTNCLFGDVLNKVFCNLVVNIRFQQRQTYFAHCFLDVILRELSFRSELFKGLIEFFGKTLECHWFSPIPGLNCFFVYFSCKFHDLFCILLYLSAKSIFIRLKGDLFGTGCDLF